MNRISKLLEMNKEDYTREIVAKTKDLNQSKMDLRLAMGKEDKNEISYKEKEIKRLQDEIKELEDKKASVED